MMTEGQPKYDDSIEKQLNVLLCSLDKEPKVCVEPVEASKYLNISLYESEEGFQQRVEVLVSKFSNYLNGFVKTCINEGALQAILLPTISRLLVQYKQAHYTFTHSPLRLEWKQYSQHFIIPNPTGDYNITKKQNYTRQAYRFFHKASSIQLYFIEKIIDDLTLHLKANNIDTHEHPEPKFKEPEHTIKHFFSIQKSAKEQSHNILKYIHKKLNDEGYIDCSMTDFKQVFASENPHPIIWLKDYVHLTYLIKNLTGQFLRRKNKPSNNQIAREYFFNKKLGVHFKHSMLRHQNDPNPADKNYLDEVIKGSIPYFLGD